jgi:hypothetical protein
MCTLRARLFATGLGGAALTTVREARMQPLALVISLRVVTVSLPDAPLPALGFVLQVAALASAIGSGVALLAKRRDRDADTWAITAARGSLGLVVGVIAAVITALSA